MATGLPRTKWNGDLTTNPSESDYSKRGLDINISYKDKCSESKILLMDPEFCTKLWQGRKTREYDNRLYYGDNLPILASFLQDPAIRGNLKLVYIDPPFATRSVFQSRSQKDAYHDLLSGSQYIEFIRKRLILLRELMSDDGSIYVHLDENMVFYVKIILDEVFGKNNYQNFITRKKCNPKNYTRKRYGNVSDYILFYTKSNKYTWNRPYEMWKYERAIKEYQYVEEETGRRYKKVPIHAPGVRNGETGKPWRGMNPPPGKHWQFPPTVLEEMDNRGEIYWSPSGNPRRKIYLDESNGVPIQDIWLGFKDAYNQNIKITGYPTEKNPELLSRIIRASSNKGDLVLDCFSGSGTTLAVASSLGRRWIGIDNSLEAIKTTLLRFSKGLEPMGDFMDKKKSRKTSLNKDHPLLDLIKDEESLKTEKTNPDKVKTINDFSLYSTQSNKDNLEEVLKQWLMKQ